MGYQKWNRIVGGGWFVCYQGGIIAFAVAGAYSGYPLPLRAIHFLLWSLLTTVQAGIFLGKRWAFWIAVMTNALSIYGTAVIVVTGPAAGYKQPLYSSIFYFLEAGAVFAYSLYVLSRPKVPPVIPSSAEEVR